MSETTIAFYDALGRRIRMGSWQDQKISTYRKIHEAIDDERWDEAAELANYFVDEASVCFGIYRQWIPDLNAFLTENGVSKAELAAVTARIVAKLALPDGTPWNVRRSGTRPRAGRGARRPPAARAGARGAREARRAEGDVAAVPRPRRRPHLRPDERDRRAVRRVRDRPHVGQGAAPALLLALREVRHRQGPVGRGPRGADARRVRGDARPPRRARAHRRLRADRDRRPLHPALRSLRVGRPHDSRRPDRGHPGADGGAVQLVGLSGAAPLEPRPDRRLPLLHALRVPDGGNPDRRFGYPLRVVEPPEFGGGCARRLAAEVPVADVQGPDRGPGGVLRAGRTHEAPGSGRSHHTTDDLPDIVVAMPGAG